MCQNLQWLMCALQGLLPGQRRSSGRGQLHFATAPRDLDWRVWDNPALGAAWWMDPHDRTFAVSDVYFAEVAILSTVCRNHGSSVGELFGVGRGELFLCDLDRQRYRELAELLAGAG